jgi:uncharacterized protein YceH (UPF0502 family)
VAGDNKKTAEQRFRDAFERLKLGVPEVLPTGTPVSQNNTAKEAGCDPSALRKTRFPSLIAEIQHYVDSHAEDRPVSARQTMLKQRQKSRSTRDTLQDIKRQRDAAQGLIADANFRIVELTEEVSDLRRRLEDLQSSVKPTPLKL